jgi:hypothetical protein
MENALCNTDHVSKRPAERLGSITRNRIEFNSGAAEFAGFGQRGRPVTAWLFS